MSLDRQLFTEICFNFHVGSQLVYNALLSGIQPGDSGTHIHTSILFQILNPHRLLQSTVYC